MKQALMLCGGQARRLQPYSQALPKSCMPFLNLPLLSFSWFYMEQLAVSRFLLNAHLFPEKLSQTVDFLSQSRQKTDILFESEPLGGAGTLNKLKRLLQKEESFFYINGDSLFFPSDKSQLPAFEEDFLQSGAEASFFVSSPEWAPPHSGLLCCDEERNLKFIGKDWPKHLFPFHFSGLALFKSSFLEQLKPGAFCLFSDFIIPLLSRKKLRVFPDPGAVVLEAGEKSAYLKSMSFCLNFLFDRAGQAEREKKGESVVKQGFPKFSGSRDGRESKEGQGELNAVQGGQESEELGLGHNGLKFEKSGIGLNIDKADKFAWLQGLAKETYGSVNKDKASSAGRFILKEIFSRFDPEDKIVGLSNGQAESGRFHQPLLAPCSVEGLEKLRLKGPAVIGPQARFTGDSLLSHAVLGSGVSWRGELRDDILLRFSLEKG